jgi:hypothetical protein
MLRSGEGSRIIVRKLNKSSTFTSLRAWLLAAGFEAISEPSVQLSKNYVATKQVAVKYKDIKVR